MQRVGDVTRGPKWSDGTLHQLVPGRFLGQAHSRQLDISAVRCATGTAEIATREKVRVQDSSAVTGWTQSVVTFAAYAVSFGQMCQRSQGVERYWKEASAMVGKCVLLS